MTARHPWYLNWRKRLATERGRLAVWAIAAFILVGAVYSPSIRFDYAPVDDTYFVTENPLVQGGLSWTGFKAAWTSVHAGYWAPLLWLTFMADQALSGGAPWSFHLTNVLLFAASAVLVFLLVRRWTKSNSFAWAVVMLWALHPIRVESVVWVTERKDVLSGVFFFLGLWFYTVGWSRRLNADPSAATDSPSRRAPNWGVILAWLCMLLGGMAKQVVFVMPGAMVLLDVWPLQRTTWDLLWKDAWRLIAEKWAFWVLALGLAWLVGRLQADEQAISAIPWSARLVMIPIHYLFYFQKMIWPSALAPLQADLPRVGWRVAASLAVLAGGSFVAWRWRRRSPWLLWGWLWGIGLMIPFSGVVWAGAERVALRWLYLPQLGVTLVGVRAAAALFRSWRVRRTVTGWILALVLLAYADVTLRTQAHWRDANVFGIWIYQCHPEQGAACAIGGDSYLAYGDWNQALEAYYQGIELGSPDCLARWGMVQINLGYPERAADAWEAFEHNWPRPLLDFWPWERAEERELRWRIRGQILRAQKDLPGARNALREAARWEPHDDAFGLAEFLRVCFESGQPTVGADVIERMQKAANLTLREWKDLFPFYVLAWKNGARGYAFAYFDEYAHRQPDDAVNLNYMARLVATARPDGLDHARMSEWPQAALRWAELAWAHEERPPLGVWETLAAARANAGDSTGAVAAAEQALALAQKQNEPEAVAEIEKRLAAYRLGLTWQE